MLKNRVAYGTSMDADFQAQERREEQAQPWAREANQMLQLRQMLPKGTTFNNILYWVWFDLIRVVVYLGQGHQEVHREEHCGAGCY